jgi:hypothetical protein
LLLMVFKFKKALKTQKKRNHRTFTRVLSAFQKTIAGPSPVLLLEWLLGSLLNGPLLMSLVAIYALCVMGAMIALHRDLRGGNLELDSSGQLRCDSRAVSLACHGPCADRRANEFHCAFFADLISPSSLPASVSCSF